MTKVTVVPTQTFHHNEFHGRKGVELEGVPKVQAKLLYTAGLIEAFEDQDAPDDDEATLEADAEAARKKAAAAHENKMNPAPGNKSTAKAKR